MAGGLQFQGFTVESILRFLYLVDQTMDTNQINSCNTLQTENIATTRKSSCIKDIFRTLPISNDHI